jgi:hypothetical protein
VGDAVVLATRIETITPPDEIYMSAAAWLAMNQAEVRTSFVDSFALKGLTDPVAVYRVEQTHRMRVISDQYIVLTDLQGFGAIAEGSSVPSSRARPSLPPCPLGTAGCSPAPAHCSILDSERRFRECRIVARAPKTGLDPQWRERPDLDP